MHEIFFPLKKIMYFGNADIIALLIYVVIFNDEPSKNFHFIAGKINLSSALGVK